MAIIITKNGKNALRIEQTPPKREDDLQRYISDNPESLPLDEIKEGTQLLVIGREFDTDSGPIDVLAVDGDGDIYIIETKLFKNPDKRLVIAQMLDYGASLWKTYRSGEEFLGDIDSFLADSKAGGLSQRLGSLYGLGEEEVQDARGSIKRNLADGNIKFVVLMDKLHERLRDLIMFINQKSRFNIYAVEMEFYQHEGMEIVIPKLFGAEVKKDIGPASFSPGRKKWTEQMFFDEVKQSLSAAEFASMKELYDGSKALADTISFGTGTASGSFNPKFLNASPRSIYTVYTHGTLQINFPWLRRLDRGKDEEKCPDQEGFRDRFKQSLDSINFHPMPTDYVEEHVEVPPSVWMPKTKQFLEVVRKVFKSPANA